MEGVVKAETVQKLKQKVERWKEEAKKGSMAKWLKSRSPLKGIAERKVSERRERVSGGKGETEEEDGKNKVEQREEAKLRGELSLVET